MGINVPYPNKDGSFSQTSRLDFIPQQGDMYSCSVTHPALKLGMTRMYDVNVQLPSIGPAVFCGLGLTVGLLGVASGTFFLIKGNECSSLAGADDVISFLYSVLSGSTCFRESA